MNAPFFLTQPVESQLLSRLDMADQENIKDARAGLDAAGSDIAKLAVWAGRWGAALVERCSIAEGALVDPVGLESVETDLQTAGGRIEVLEEGIRTCARAIDKLLEREVDSLAAKHFEQISKIGDDLEAVL